MNLADFFPQDIKDDFARRNIDVGKTLLVEIPDFNISYRKYWIIIAVSPSYIAGVVVNTEINKNIFWNEQLRELNIPILQKENPFLQYDSFVDCSKIRKCPSEEIQKAITENPKIVVGNITDILLKKIHITITNAKTISKKDKKEFGFI